jgi:hypothetical protein
MFGSVTFSYCIDDKTIQTTIMYTNPFLSKISLEENIKKYLFDLCAMSYITGMLDADEVNYSNLKITNSILNPTHQTSQLA